MAKGFFKPAFDTGTPAALMATGNLMHQPWWMPAAARQLETDKVQRGTTFLLNNPRPEDTDAVGKALDMLHAKGMHVVLKTKFPRKEHFARMEQGDTYAVTICELDEKEETGKRLGGMFDAEAKSDCMTCVFIDWKSSKEYAARAVEGIPADSFVICGFMMGREEKHRLKERGRELNRVVVFTETAEVRE